MNLNYFRFAAHPDKLTEASNRVALILASNTPFYPVYLYFILGHAGLPWLFISGASFPFFVVTLWIARRHAVWGRVWLCVVATLNSIFVTWLLGEASCTALFLIPCISLAVLSFRRREWLPMAACTGLPFVSFYFLQGHFPTPPAIYSARDYHSLLVLNEGSVASISAVLAYLFPKAHSEAKPST